MLSSAWFFDNFREIRVAHADSCLICTDFAFCVAVRFIGIFNTSVGNLWASKAFDRFWNSNMMKFDCLFFCFQSRHIRDEVEFMKNVVTNWANLKMTDLDYAYQNRYQREWTWFLSEEFLKLCRNSFRNELLDETGPVLSQNDCIGSSAIATDHRRIARLHFQLIGKEKHTCRNFGPEGLNYLLFCHG